MKILKLVIVFILFYSANALATIIEDIKIENNNRISKQTIITYGDIELKKDYNNDDINQILKNLYEIGSASAEKIYSAKYSFLVSLPGWYLVI